MNAPDDPTGYRDHRPAPESAAAATADVWCVMRVDDNGNEFIVRQDLDHAAAAALAAEFESRGHKQAYWIRRR